MTSTPSTRRLLDGVSVQNEAAYERLQLHTAPHVPADAARRRPRISSLRLCLIPPSGMQLSRLAKASRALRVGLAKARVLLTLEERREGVFLSDDAAAAATHRSHRRALILVREAVALADRQLFDRDLRRRRPFRAAAPRRRRAVTRVLGARLGDRSRPARRVERRLPPVEGLDRRTDGARRGCIEAGLDEGPGVGEELARRLEEGPARPAFTAPVEEVRPPDSV